MEHGAIVRIQHRYKKRSVLQRQYSYGTDASDDEVAVDSRDISMQKRNCWRGQLYGHNNKVFHR